MTVYHFEKEEVEKCACGCAVPGKGIHGVVAIAALILKQFPSQILIGCYPWTDEEIVCIYLFIISMYMCLCMCAHMRGLYVRVWCVCLCVWDTERERDTCTESLDVNTRERERNNDCLFAFSDTFTTETVKVKICCVLERTYFLWMLYLYSCSSMHYI